MSDKYIKIHFTFKRPLSFNADNILGEYLWALPITHNTAKVNSIPIGTTEIAEGDLVEYDPDNDNEIIRVLESGTRTRHVRYDQNGPKEEVSERYREIRDYLGTFDINTEGGPGGIIGLTVPGNIDDDTLQTLCEQSPVPLEALGFGVEFEFVPAPGPKRSINVLVLRKDDRPLTLADFEAIPQEPITGKVVGWVKDYWSACPKRDEPDHLHVIWQKANGELRRACVNPEPPVGTVPEEWRQRYEAMTKLPQIFINA